MKDLTRADEWFVPNFGPLKFRIFIGMLFLPYTGMCISFTIIGSMMATTIDWERVLAIFLIYFFGLGIAAHSADSLGSKKNKPWGTQFTKKELMIMMFGSLFIACIIGIYYVIIASPLLFFIGILELFFLFAYNYELFGGYFHNNFWFSISWGSLPLLAGYIIQTNSLSMLPLLMSMITFIVSYIEINISRRYKELKRKSENEPKTDKLEYLLKILSLTTISFGVAIMLFRYFLV